MDLFPYKPRKNQIAVMQTIKNILASKGTLVFESGTGSGKTICTVASALEYAVENNKKVIYTTRTNAQQRQVIIELRSIRKKAKDFKQNIFGVGIQGRANMCLLARKNPELAKGTAEELSRLCASEKKKARSSSIIGKEKGCIYYKRFLNHPKKVKKLIERVSEEIPTAEEFVDICDESDICPYEINKMLVRDAQLVVVPYVYVFDQLIRNMLFDWLSVSEEDMILIVDEAHNLPDYIRESFSVQLSVFMLESCILEAEKFGDPTLIKNKFTVSAFCKSLIEILRDIRDTYIYGMMENGLRRESAEKEDAFIPSHEFETEILSRLGITSVTLHDIIGDLIAYGEQIRDYKEKEGSLPRSYIHKLGGFLDFWFSLEVDQYAKLVVNDLKNPYIEAYCLDPSVGTGIIKAFHSSIHMSGTLEPLEEYRDSLGLSEDTELVTYPSPFPPGNRLVLYLQDVTTKYDEISKDKKIFSKMHKYITDVCNRFPKNTMIFFPSFEMMTTFLNKGIKKDLDRYLYVEKQGMSQSELMGIVSEFKESGYKEDSAATMFSVMGGRISEGVDFPSKELEIAILVGIPYPKPTARQRGLQNYYDIKFRKGWEYTVEAPTARKLLQSIGRLIRKEDDRGVAIILDRRAPRFKRYMKDLRESKNLIKDIDNFMEIK